MSIPTNSFSVDLRFALEHAQNEAAQRHGNYLDVEHLLLGLLRQKAGPAHELFIEHNVNTGALYDQIAAEIGMERPTPAAVKDLSRNSKSALDRALKEAKSLGSATLNTGHMLLGLMSENDGIVHDILAGIALTPDDVRGYLRSHADPTPAPNITPMPNRPTLARRRNVPSGENDPEVILVPFRERAKKKPAAKTPSRWGNWPWIIVAAALIIAYLLFALPGSTGTTFVLVIIGWIFSLCLHEFSHALVAYLGGDYTVRDKGYLTFNPLKYTHPVLSIAMPLLFLAMGGIGLPGGAVYIERHRLRSKWWDSAVSAAGPAANLLFALVLAAPFLLGLVKLDMIVLYLYLDQVPASASIWENPTIWTAVAFLVMLQVTSVVFNLLPIPPLDGFGILSPLLDERTRYQMAQIGMYSLFLIFMLLWFNNPVSDAFWDMIYRACDNLDIPRYFIEIGRYNFQFWRRD